MQYSNRTFKDETVELDGNRFIGCTFERCTLMYLGGPIPYLDSCHFDASPFVFEKGAGNALEFLRELYHCGLRENVEALFADLRLNPPRAG